jgi:asparagine synthase (glutamine-hydrolysing)
MCGIAGFQGTFPAELLEAMSRRLAHRGPDGAGCAMLPAEDPRRTLGLAHRRLAIIDLSPEGGQPMTTCCPACGSTALQDLALVYNGEVYNYRALRAELESAGHRFHSATDSEVLLHLYAARGLDMLSRLNGIFAFAICDGRAAGRPAGVEQGDLILARDPIGVKPLYYTTTDDGVLFASELKALIEAPGLRRELDPIAVHYHLAYLWTPAPRTMLVGVRKLEPGCALIVRCGAVVRHWQYADLPYGQGVLRSSERGIAAMVRETLARAVERQLVADVPVGAFLSGGLDSSAVVAMMRAAREEGSIDCYTINASHGAAMEGVPADLPYAERVAQHLGVRLHRVEVRPDAMERLDRMVYALDEPQGDPAALNTLLIAEQARMDGIPVLLSGAGGDDLFSGYRRHLALRLERLWAWLPSVVRRVIGPTARRVGAGELMGGLHHHALRRAVKMLSYVDYPADQRLVTYFWWSSDELRRRLYSPDLAAQTATVATAEPLLASLGRIPEDVDPLDGMLYLETRHFLADHNLNYTDKMGMAVGVEIRVPLLDLELVQLAARIPAALKQRGRAGKAILKRAMEEDLPRDVIHRPKAGFGAPLRDWLRTTLRDRVEETLSPAVLRDRGLFDPSAVRRLVELDRMGRVDGAYTIFALMCLELWCRHFLDRAA